MEGKETQENIMKKDILENTSTEESEQNEKKKEIDIGSVLKSELESELEKSLAEDELRELEGILINGAKRKSVYEQIYGDEEGKLKQKKDDTRNDYKNACNTGIPVTDINKGKVLKKVVMKRAWKKHVLMMKIITWM